jgi:cytochrome c-type biogenesis protein
MQQLFITINQWISGSFAIAITGSLIWGIFTVVLSPCHLAAIPLIIGYISSKGGQTPRKAFATSLTFSAGIFVSIALIGFVTISMGMIAGDLGKWGDIIIAAVLIFFGLTLMGVINLNWNNLNCGVGIPDSGKKLKNNPWGTFAFGLLIGIGLGPCTFAFMVPVMTVAFTLASSNFLQAAMVMLFYIIGYVGVIVLAGTFTGLVQRYLNWTEASSGAKIVKMVCGVLVIIAAFYTLWKAFLA